MTNIRNALMQAAGSASGDKVYVEDVFSTFLYTGSNGVASYVNNIDLSGEGGLVWIKSRGGSARDHRLFDTERGVHKYLSSEGTGAEATSSYSLTAFNNNGFTLGDDVTVNFVQTYASWSFRKQTGFFDVVTYTGTGSGQAIAHNLGCKPGMILVKLKSASGYSWGVWHKSLAINYALALDTTAAVSTDYGGGGWWNSTSPTATHFSVGTYGIPNANGEDFVAYLFADGDESDAQIFGDDGDEAIIKQGSFTPTGSGTAKQTINVGFEPQWLIIKNSTSTQSGNWWIFDNMRGFTAGDGNGSEYLLADTSGAASAFGAGSINITNQGFEMVNNAFVSSSQTFVYMAIRRGPMKEPSAGTDVYNAVTFTGTGSAADIDSGFPVDLAIPQKRTANQYYNFRDRLRGNKQTLQLPLTSAQYSNASVTCEFDDMNGFHHAGSNIDTGYTANGQSSIAYMFRRYRSVFDMAVYSGTGSNLDVTHNLNAVPEMQIIKRLDSGTSADWAVYHKDVPATGSYSGQYFFLNDGSIGYAGSTTVFRDTPTASVFKVGTNDMVNNSSGSYVWYGFASLAGISHVGSYTGTGNDINVTDLGAAARFVFIKRADEWVGGAGGYYVFDTARGNSKMLLLNTDDIEENIVSGRNAAFTFQSTGFQITTTTNEGFNSGNESGKHLSRARPIRDDFSYQNVADFSLYWRLRLTTK